VLLKEIKEHEIEKIGRLFSKGVGEEVLGILNRVFYNTVSFNPSCTHTTAFSEGQRDIVHIFRCAAELVKQQERKNGDEKA